LGKLGLKLGNRLLTSDLEQKTLWNLTPASDANLWKYTEIVQQNTENRIFALSHSYPKENTAHSNTQATCHICHWELWYNFTLPMKWWVMGTKSFYVAWRVVHVLIQTRHHEDAWGKGGIAVHILNLQTAIQPWFNDVM
jgi:hypothetical protein